MLLLQCMSDTDNPRKCHSYREDYLECLHHRKEVRRDTCAVWSASMLTSGGPHTIHCMCCSSRA